MNLNKRWIFTHLLPIILVVIVVAGVTIAAVPSFRQKFTGYLSKFGPWAAMNLQPKCPKIESLEVQKQETKQDNNLQVMLTLTLKDENGNPNADLMDCSYSEEITTCQYHTALKKALEPIKDYFMSSDERTELDNTLSHMEFEWAEKWTPDYGRLYQSLEEQRNYDDLIKRISTVGWSYDGVLSFQESYRNGSDRLPKISDDIRLRGTKTPLQSALVELGCDNKEDLENCLKNRIYKICANDDSGLFNSGLYAITYPQDVQDVACIWKNAIEGYNPDNDPPICHKTEMMHLVSFNDLTDGYFWIIKYYKNPSDTEPTEIFNSGDETLGNLGYPNNFSSDNEYWTFNSDPSGFEPAKNITFKNPGRYEITPYLETFDSQNGFSYVAGNMVEVVVDSLNLSAKSDKKTIEPLLDDNRNQDQATAAITVNYVDEDGKEISTKGPRSLIVEKTQLDPEGEEADLDLEFTNSIGKLNIETWQATTNENGKLQFQIKTKKDTKEGTLKLKFKDEENGAESEEIKIEITKIPDPLEGSLESRYLCIDTEDQTSYLLVDKALALDPSQQCYLIEQTSSLPQITHSGVVQLDLSKDLGIEFNEETKKKMEEWTKWFNEKFPQETIGDKIVFSWRVKIRDKNGNVLEDLKIPLSQSYYQQLNYDVQTGDIPALSTLISKAIGVDLYDVLQKWQTVKYTFKAGNNFVTGTAGFNIYPFEDKTNIGFETKFNSGDVLIVLGVGQIDQKLKSLNVYNLPSANPYYSDPGLGHSIPAIEFPKKRGLYVIFSNAGTQTNTGGTLDQYYPSLKNLLFSNIGGILLAKTEWQYGEELQSPKIDLSFATDLYASYKDLKGQTQEATLATFEKATGVEIENNLPSLSFRKTLVLDEETEKYESVESNTSLVPLDEIKYNVAFVGAENTKDSKITPFNMLDFLRDNYPVFYPNYQNQYLQIEAPEYIKFSSDDPNINISSDEKSVAKISMSDFLDLDIGNSIFPIMGYPLIAEIDPKTSLNEIEIPLSAQIFEEGAETVKKGELAITVNDLWRRIKGQVAFSGFDPIPETTVKLRNDQGYVIAEDVPVDQQGNYSVDIRAKDMVADSGLVMPIKLTVHRKNDIPVLVSYDFLPENQLAANGEIILDKLSITQQTAMENIIESSNQIVAKATEVLPEGKKDETQIAEVNTKTDQKQDEIKNELISISGEEATKLLSQASTNENDRIIKINEIIQEKSLFTRTKEFFNALSEKLISFAYQTADNIKSINQNIYNSISLHLSNLFTKINYFVKEISHYFNQLFAA